MNEVDPKTVVDGCAEILDAEGNWPNFHDAEVSDLAFRCGDVRPDDDVYIGARITATLTLCALQFPIRLQMRFEDCREIRLCNFAEQNPIMDLVVGVEERGYLRDGRPMSPYLVFHFLPAWEFELSFKCFRALVLEAGVIDRQ